MMLSSTSRPTLIFPVEDPRVDPPREKCSHPRTRPSKFSKGAAARRYALRAWRCAHRTPARVDRLAPIFWTSWSGAGRAAPARHARAGLVALSLVAVKYTFR